MRKPLLFLCGLVLILLASSVSAQTTVTVGPVLITDKIAFDAIQNVPTAAEAQGLTYKLVDTRDGVPTTPITLPAPVCTGSPYSCASAVTQPIIDQLNKVGQHALTLTATSPTGGESPASVPFLLVTAPAAPTALRVIR